MTPLSGQKCTACHPDAKHVTEKEIPKYLKQIPEWEIITVDDIKRLIRIFSLEDYKAAVDFTNKVAGLAEEEGHHPEIILEWGKVTVSWWSQEIKNLHINDFIMASKTDKIIE